MAQTPNSADPFEFLKSLWSPLGLPMTGMVAPMLDVAEIDKRIADMKSVENWLSLNLNVLRTTVQALEIQKATLSAMKSNIVGAAQAVNPGATPPDAWWAILQQAQQAAERVRNDQNVPAGKKKS